MNKERQEQVNDDAQTPNEDARTPETPDAGPTDANDDLVVSVEPVGDDELAELREKAAERDELLDRLQRQKADTHNFRNRLLKDTAAQKQYATQTLVSDLLPVLDNLELAIASPQPDAAGEAAQGLLEGVKMVHQQTLKVLADHGVTPIDATGEPFDPTEHEAIMQQPSADHAKGTVMAQTRKGYRLRDRVIRPAQVVVSAGPPAEESTTEAQASGESDPPTSDEPATGQE